MIGITSTIPQEIVWASGEKVVDLNNILLQHDAALAIDVAEKAGFPGNICAWIKGLYGVIHQQNIKRIIGVSEGDCSSTRGLMEVLENEGIEVIPFAYPQERDRALARTKLQQQLTMLIEYFKTDWKTVERKYEELNLVRDRLATLDRLAINGGIPSRELYLWQVGSSDFNSDPVLFGQQLENYLTLLDHSSRQPITLGYIGVPPMQPGIFELIEQLGARITFFEVPRQFCLLPTDRPLVDAYLDYTYPYHLSHRLADIQQAIQSRKLQGLIHYTQSFCFRQIEDIVLRKELKLPILTLELDRPGDIDTRTRLRLESFIDSLR